MRRRERNALVFSSYSAAYHIKQLVNLWVSAASAHLLSVCEIKVSERALTQIIKTHQHTHTHRCMKSAVYQWVKGAVPGPVPGPL